MTPMKRKLKSQDFNLIETNVIYRSIMLKYFFFFFFEKKTYTTNSKKITIDLGGM